MDEFNSLEKVKKLFLDKGLKGDDKIYLALLQDSKKYSGMVSGMEYPYSGLLLCFGDDGIGYFHLVQPKLSLMIKLEKLVIDKDSYVFLSSDNIKSLEVKKFALLDKKRKEVIIKTNDKKTHYLYQKIEDDLLPYHNEEFKKFLDKYDK